MSETKHTPGPWRVAPRSDYPEHADINVDAGTRGYVALCGKAGDEEAEANARLIAAAPELLDALRETLRALESHLDESCRDHGLGHRDMLCSCNQHEVVRARAAIAKTEGR